MQKERWRSRACKCCGNLAADQPRLAHSRNDHAAFATVEQLDGLLEAGVKPLDQAGNGFGLDSQDALGGFKAHDLSHARTNFEISISRFTSGLNCSRGKAFEPSDKAFDGSSCTSTKIPSTPAATLARARGSINSGWPPPHFSSAAGECTQCGAADTTREPQFS